MTAKRFAAVSSCFGAIALMLGATQALAAGSTTVLKFYDASTQSTGVGFDANDPNAIPPIGGSVVTTITLHNIGAQFGKRSGAAVGHVLLDCTVLAVNISTESVGGICSGIAHVPNGYFTFGGNGGFVDARVAYFDITGGVGPYANDRGQIEVVNNKNGSSVATVTLSS